MTHGFPESFDEFAERVEKFWDDIGTETALPLPADDSLFVSTFGHLFQTDDGSFPTHFSPVSMTFYIDDAIQD